MSSVVRFRESAFGASRRARGWAVSRLSRLPETRSREARQPRYHGWALDGAPTSGRVSGNPGGTALDIIICRPEAQTWRLSLGIFFADADSIEIQKT